MKLLDWNVRGLGDENKCSLVHDVLTSCQPSIACFQETKLEAAPTIKLRSFLPTNFNNHAIMPSMGSSSGLLVAWDTSAYSGQVIASHGFHLIVRFSSTTSETVFVVTTVYAPCVQQERQLFLDEINATAALIFEPWIVISDFNMYQFKEEKS